MKQKDKVLKILIISGGGSSERKISLWSAKQVKLALRSKGYKVKVFDLRRGTDDLKKLSNFFFSQLVQCVFDKGIQCWSKLLIRREIIGFN